jgi:hypothetical protein
MLESTILVISFAVLTAILPFSATAKSSNGGAGAAKDSGATVQARWPRNLANLPVQQSTKIIRRRN